MPRLITIPFSHYCEKARWALQRAEVSYDEDGHLPLFHWLPTRRAGGSRTVPVLVVDGRVIADSTDIAAWADAQRPGALLPTDEVDRAAALQLEDDFDRQLGPASRRWAYFQLLPRRDLQHLIMRGVPRWEQIALRVTRPLAIAVLRRGLNVDAAGAERSRAKVDAAFARVGELLEDGRRFLVGNRFTIADLTFAALAAPVVVPANYGVQLPALDDFTGDARDQVVAWRATPAGRFALRLYETERAAARRAA
jgi:glutathione S-transferase